MSRLFYLPLEPYRERYTLQLSAAKTGWYERNWIKAGIDYIRIEGDGGALDTPIKHGQVLDATRRCVWSMDQIAELLFKFRHGGIKSDDVIFLDDFWTPGFEALPYVMHQTGIRPRIYAYCWAQSVDEFDFTYPMRSWMRSFELGIGDVLTGIFVANTMLKDLLVKAGIGYPEQIHVVGLPFDSEEVMSRMPENHKLIMSGIADSKHAPRKNQVVFSSRWDKEKNPMFFLKVASEVLKHWQDVRFIVCTSAPKLRSNDPRLVEYLRDFKELYQDRIVVKENLTKEEYYQILYESKIQFNCADQDWVSFTLLEASVAGCFPIYPYFRSFPETFANQLHPLYQHMDVSSAVAMIEGILDRNDLWDKETIESRSSIHKRFDLTWLRMAIIMGLVQLDPNEPGSITDEQLAQASKLYGEN